MAPIVTPTNATLGAVVTGLALGRLDAPTWKVVEQAFLRHAVLIFPEQHLTEAEQVAFARRFGEIELLAPSAEQKAVAISNVKPDGTIMGADEHRYKALRGNEGWHTDSSYMPLAAKASCLSAQVVPSAGGETEWADMRAAYDALPQAMKEIIEPLVAEHSIFHSRAQIGFTEFTDEERAAMPPVRQRLVRRHPGSGRKTLYSPRTPRISSTGRCRTACCCCAI